MEMDEVMTPQNENKNPNSKITDEDLDKIDLVDPINWNQIEDQVDLDVWNRLVENFWVPEKIPLAQDLKSWDGLTDDERATTSHVFAGLTLLDTIQSKVGAVSLIPDSRTPHEEAVYSNITFMEAIHAKSYSSIFSTFLTTREINELFRWAKKDKFLKKKAAIVLKYYRGDDPEKRKIASTLLESFLFYSGFFMPLWWGSKGKLTNTADLIRLIVRDEAVHGYYIGYKFNQALQESSPERQAELEKFARDLMFELYENEVAYTEYLYDALGLTDHVKTFLRYNANKAFQNLGFKNLPFNEEDTEILPQILASLNPNGEENSDFFSGTPFYLVAAGERQQHLSDDEWGSAFDFDDDDDWDDED